MPVRTPRELLVVDLRTYGENDVAQAVADADEAVLERIFDRADHYLYSDDYKTPSGASPLLALTLALAAIEVVEGTHRPPRWKRRKLKGVYPGY